MCRERGAKRPRVSSIQVRAPSFGGSLFSHLRRTARVRGRSFGTRIACSHPPPHNVSLLQPQCVTNALRFLGHFLRPQEVAVRFPAAPTFRRAVSFLSMRRHRRRRSCPHLALRVAVQSCFSSRRICKALGMPLGPVVFPFQIIGVASLGLNDICQDTYGPYG